MMDLDHTAKRVWSVKRRDDAVPLRAELLPLTGAITDSRARAIDPRHFERRAPKAAAAFLMLVLGLSLWTLLWQIVKLALQLLWHWAEPAATVVAALAGGAVWGMFLIGIGLLG